MITLYDLSQAGKWDEIVKSFPNYDVYYLSGYLKAFHMHKDGEPYLLFYESEELKAIYVYMRRMTDLPNVFDAITPYGYGGVLFSGSTSEENLKVFWRCFVSKMREERIVDSFIRYHPLLKNAEKMSKISTVVGLGKTIGIDITSEDVIWDNCSGKNRNVIRKAIKCGVEIFHAKDISLFDEFMRMYNSTMDRDNATDYYYFQKEFYESIHRDLNCNYEMFYAQLDGRIVAMSIILFANRKMHYHLSGSLFEYRNVAPTNLLLYRAAQWGCQQGFEVFHLGGGVGSGEDNLYKFKAAFNKMSDYSFSIGKEIYLPGEYDLLVDMRAKSDANFDENVSFFPLYRA